MVNDSSLEILQLFQLIELQYLIHHDAFLIKTKQNKQNKKVTGLKTSKNGTIRYKALNIIEMLGSE